MNDPLKRFRVQCFVRVAAIGASLFISLVFFETRSYMASALLGGAVLAQLWALVQYVEKTNRDVARLLRSIRYADFSQTFTAEGRAGSFEELGAALREVMDDFRAARAETEEHYRYLQTVIQHVGVGLVSFRQDGSVGLVNAAAKRLLRVNRLRNVRALAARSPELVDVLLRLEAGEKGLVKLVEDDELLQLAVYATEFKLRGDLYKLISIQNIQSELEEKEIEAWQQLTRVLTHEIMNSITPIASLASTVNDLLHEPETAPDDGVPGAVLAGETVEDVRGAVRTIEKRSRSLLAFVDAYRSLTRIPRPDLRILPVRELVDSIDALMRPQLRARGIRLVTRVEPPTLTLVADPGLVERVLINLIQNAMEALRERPGGEIGIAAVLDDRGRPAIRVTDDGPGIVPEALEKVFVPFFTTKKEGSGIGLSFSREIMRQHGGSLTVSSRPGARTTFTMRF